MVESDAGPHRNGLGCTPFAGAPGRDHGTGTDEAFEVGGVGVEGTELRDRTSANGDHRALAGLGHPHRFGQAGAQVSDTD